MDSITLTAATIRGLKSATRRTGTKNVTLDGETGAFKGTDKDGKVRVAGTVDGATGAVAYTTKPKKVQPKAKAEAAPEAATTE